LKVHLYSKFNCNWCNLLKVRLIQLQIDYIEFRVDESVENLDKLRSLIPGVKTVPQMFVDNKLVGDYERSTAWLDGYEKSKEINVLCSCANDAGESDIVRGDEGKS
jgi:glutaredoxin